MPLPDDPLDDAALREALADALGFVPRRVEGAVPLWAFERRRAGLRRVEVAPVGLYAPAGAHDALLRLAAGARLAPATRYALNLHPADPQAPQTAEALVRLGFQVVARETHVLRLDRPIEAVRDGYHATKRAQARRTPRIPSEILAGTRAAHVDDYLGAYAASLARWGRNDMPYPAALFHRLLDSPAVRYRLHYVHGRLACGVVLLMGRRHALYWQGVSRIDDDQKAAFPMLRLMDQVIAELQAEGIAHFNLGASDHLPNVRRFKEELGAVATPHAALVHEGAAWRAAAAGRACWQGLRAGRRPVGNG